MSDSSNVDFKNVQGGIGVGKDVAGRDIHNVNPETADLLKSVVDLLNQNDKAALAQLRLILEQQTPQVTPPDEGLIKKLREDILTLEKQVETIITTLTGLPSAGFDGLTQRFSQLRMGVDQLEGEARDTASLLDEVRKRQIIMTVAFGMLVFFQVITLMVFLWQS